VVGVDVREVSIQRAELVRAHFRIPRDHLNCVRSCVVRPRSPRRAETDYPTAPGATPSSVLDCPGELWRPRASATEKAVDPALDHSISEGVVEHVPQRPQPAATDGASGTRRRLQGRNETRV
jgi:hypothetical protein